jgi:hypothetical protein
MFGLIDRIRKALPMMVFATCYLFIVALLFLA